MSWGLVAVGTVSAIGMGASAAASSAQSSAISKAGKANQDATRYAADVQRGMYDDTVKRYEPYSNLGLSALPQLQSAILGGPVSYDDPNYHPMSDQERAHEIWKGMQSGKYEQSADFQKDIRNGEDPLNRIMRDRSLIDLAGEKMYRAPDGSIVGAAPKLSMTYDHKASPAAQYQLQQGTKMFNRAAASRGLSGSGQAVTGLADLSQRTFAEDYDKQIGRLGGLVDIHRGAASGLAQAGQNTGNSLANIAMQGGQNQANLAMQQGDAKAGLYSGIGNAAMSGANMYMMNNYLNKRG